MRERVRSMKLRPHATEAATLRASRPPYVSAACKPSGMSTMELMPPMRCVSVRVRVRARARVWVRVRANPNPNPNPNPNLRERGVALAEAQVPSEDRAVSACGDDL